jgi:hypothetical protein
MKMKSQKQRKCTHCECKIHPKAIQSAHVDAKGKVWCMPCYMTPGVWASHQEDK